MEPFTARWFTEWARGQGWGIPLWLWGSPSRDTGMATKGLPEPPALFLLSVDTVSLAPRDTAKWQVCFIFPLRLNQELFLYDSSSLPKESLWIGFMVILSSNGQGVDFFLLSLCLIRVPPRSSRYPVSRGLAPRFSSCQTIQRAVCGSVAIAGWSTRDVRQRVMGMSQDHIVRQRPPGWASNSALKAPTCFSAECLLEKDAEPTSLTVACRIPKEYSTGHCFVHKHICVHECTHIYTHAHTHTHTGCELIPGKRLLVWATTDVLWCIGYMTYKIPTKYFAFGTEKWTASRGKTVSLSPAINWLWCLILKFNMHSSHRYVCEWREMSGKAISNMCSLKCWSVATTYISVLQLLSLLSCIYFRENKKNSKYSVFSGFSEFHRTHDIDLTLVTMKFSQSHFLEL